MQVRRAARCATPWRLTPRAAPHPSATADAPSAVADLLVQQRDRDLQGGGVSLRPVAEQGWQETHTSRYSTTKLSRSCTQLLVSFDRLLSDERRCAAYVAAIDAALAAGARTFAVLGAGSLLPALTRVRLYEAVRRKGSRRSIRQAAHGWPAVHRVRRRCHRPVSESQERASLLYHYYRVAPHTVSTR